MKRETEFDSLFSLVFLQGPFVIPPTNNYRLGHYSNLRSKFKKPSPPPDRCTRNMDYKQRLISAAKCVYDGDFRAPIDSLDYGIQAALKPHQVEGVSWLIRRYHLGVNAILGTVTLHLSVFRMEIF